MTPAVPAGDTAPLPGRGERVMLDGLPGGPWPTVVDSCAAPLVTIAPPRLGGRLVPLPLRRPFLLAYSYREVPCEVDAELVEGPVSGAPDRYVARTSGPPRRIQRRRAVRVPIHLMAHASVGDDPDEVTVGAITENLSAGGALLRSRRPIEAGATLQVDILCGGGTGPLALEGRVVRCDRTSADQRPWRIGLAFVDPPPADEDRLVRFIFERQRELRARDTGMA